MGNTRSLGDPPQRVADYPRPPVVVPRRAHVVVRALGELLCDTQRVLEVHETFHPPTVYLPPEDVRTNLLRPSGGRSFCEWKGVAGYCDVVVGERRLERVVWTYPEPTAPYAALAGWFAVYPARVDGCWMDGERVKAQPGRFYGGWITSRVEGPFKGDPRHPELI